MPPPDKASPVTSAERNDTFGSSVLMFSAYFGSSWRGAFSSEKMSLFSALISAGNFRSLQLLRVGAAGAEARWRVRRAPPIRAAKNQRLPAGPPRAERIIAHARARTMSPVTGSRG